ncbi:hypothetical protein BJ508DRAFT_322146 [Ascobolus immersus RN42]|uniref:Uncharacterized protein n=1 Tax=Ascobolus immersus RN42 TaxID=1160509 RepID=A0A3N4IKQ1_ASCIM|nr:hypothetical protein BJ508DRAFT_322146 [Ascobolus immersus RN42]
MASDLHMQIQSITQVEAAALGLWAVVATLATTFLQLPGLDAKSLSCKPATREATEERFTGEVLCQLPEASLEVHGETEEAEDNVQPSDVPAALSEAQDEVEFDEFEGLQEMFEVIAEAEPGPPETVEVDEFEGFQEMFELMTEVETGPPKVMKVVEVPKLQKKRVHSPEVEPEEESETDETYKTSDIINPDNTLTKLLEKYLHEHGTNGYKTFSGSGSKGHSQLGEIKFYCPEDRCIRTLFNLTLEENNERESNENCPYCLRILQYSEATSPDSTPITLRRTVVPINKLVNPNNFCVLSIPTTSNGSSLYHKCFLVDKRRLSAHSEYFRCLFRFPGTDPLNAISLETFFEGFFYNRHGDTSSVRQSGLIGKSSTCQVVKAFLSFIHDPYSLVPWCRLRKVSIIGNQFLITNNSVETLMSYVLPYIFSIKILALGMSTSLLGHALGVVTSLTGRIKSAVELNLSTSWEDRLEELITDVEVTTIIMAPLYRHTESRVPTRDGMRVTFVHLFAFVRVHAEEEMRLSDAYLKMNEKLFDVVKEFPELAKDMLMAERYVGRDLYLRDGEFETRVFAHLRAMEEAQLESRV